VNGWKLSVPRSGFARGERVVIAVRPELVFLASAEHEGNIEWTGVVREHVLLGDCIRTEIELENGARMVSQMPNRAVPPFKNVGERVKIDFAPEGLIPYHFPAQGLDVELALE
jgi:ABC-type Fe3+/spermidine/putrescine transport system ATPase subunit